MLIAEAMNTHPVTLTPSASLSRAAETMRENDIGDVLVVDRKGSLRGIVTDRDIAVRAVARGRKPSAKLKDVMSTELVCVSPMQPLEQAAETMREHAIRRLPVVADGKVVGVVSLGDLATRLDDHSGLADISRAPANH